MAIRRDETELIGSWLVDGASVKADATAERIEQLVRDHLGRLATDCSGWESLYEDPTDGRLWELAYPQGHMHGGGPPMLKAISRDAAQKKYVFDRRFGSA